MDGGNHMALFNPYRGFIIHNGQITVEEILETGYYENKNPLRDVIKRLKGESNFPYKYNEESEVILYFYKEISEDIVILQFARKKDLKIRRPKEKGIEEGEEKDFPYVYIIVDLKTQVFLFEHDRSAFYATSASKNSFQKLINIYLREYNYTIEFEKILDKGEFWYHIKKMDRINYVKLSLNSPNLFGGMFETNDFLKMLKDIYNNKKVELALINEDSTLENINEEDLDDAIRYIENGGGNWSIKGVTNQNDVIKKNSKEHIRKIVIDEIENEEIISDEIKEINKDLRHDVKINKRNE